MYIIVMTLIGSFASYFQKKGSQIHIVSGLLKNINIYIGDSLYLISAY